MDTYATNGHNMLHLDVFCNKVYSNILHRLIKKSNYLMDSEDSRFPYLEDSNDYSFISYIVGDKSKIKVGVNWNILSDAEFYCKNSAVNRFVNILSKKYDLYAKMEEYDEEMFYWLIGEHLYPDTRLLEFYGKFMNFYKDNDFGYLIFYLNDRVIYNKLISAGHYKKAEYVYSILVNDKNKLKTKLDKSDFYTRYLVYCETHARYFYDLNENSFDYIMLNYCKDKLTLISPSVLF